MFLGKNSNWQYDPLTCRVTLAKSELEKKLCKDLISKLIDEDRLSVESETDTQINYKCSENFNFFDLARSTRLRVL